MDDLTHTDLQLVGRHVPDATAGPFANAQDAQAAGYDTLNPVTGTYEIGVMVEGAFVPLISEKASLVFDRIEVAKQNAPPPPPEAEVGTEATTGPLAGPTTAASGTAEYQETPPPPPPAQPQG